MGAALYAGVWVGGGARGRVIIVTFFHRATERAIGQHAPFLDGRDGWMDCSGIIATATARAPRPPYRVDIAAATSDARMRPPTDRPHSLPSVLRADPLVATKAVRRRTPRLPACLPSRLGTVGQTHSLPPPLPRPPHCMHLTLQEERHKTSRNCHFTNTTVPADSFDHEDATSAKSAASCIMCPIVRHGLSARS